MIPTPPHGTVLIPIGRAVKEFHVSRASLFKWIRTENLQRYRKPGIDRRTFVDVAELMDLLEEKAQ